MIGCGGALRSAFARGVWGGDGGGDCGLTTSSTPRGGAEGRAYRPLALPERHPHARLSHDDAYLFTAIPVAACIMQSLERAHDPGFYFQSHFLRPESLLQVLEKLGIQTRVSEGSEG